MTVFKDFIRNNNSIVRTLFHVDDNSIKVIDNNTREIIKNYRTAKIFMFMPLLKDILNEILKDIPTIQLKIIESYDKKNNQFDYQIKLCENKLFENITNIYRFDYYIHLNEDKNDKSKINVTLSMNKNNIEDENNPLNKIIIMIMLNYFENEHPSYYKKVVLQEQLKPLIDEISRHSLVLNII
jgi:hypothetical protein